ncbi:CRM1 C terminal-domain-containing protein [Histomonas meleagridis]|uniref:CRM1 C terminal-domain-containing protein n=1 Tax=Histomonas meleagridis TaxID=135588 RepID=UPI003559F216|nr:CRM1 C terminal-domain-containing protein [Histomonas meleagridis]KAH0805243.1 CRM1 C terminal-domain-containing protein [Histomonas meleagridis]
MQHDPSIVNLLDKAGNALNTGGDQTMSQQQANEFIVQFFQREDSFQCAIPIFTESKVGIIKFAALNVLRDTARLKWDSLPEEFQMNVRFFALNLIPQYVINVSQGQIRTSFLSTIDLILIEIAKHEWPQKWNTFFSDVMNFTTRDFCYNSLSIISMLLSEITEFAEDSLTSLRADEMTRALSNEIEGILNFIHNCVNDQDIELSKNALTTLKKLLRIPNTVQVLISTEWVQQLLTNYMGHPKLAVPVIGLFAEFVSKSCTDDQVIPLFITLVNSLQQAIGDDFALVSDLSGDDQFSNGFVSAILAIFKRHENVLKVNEILPQLQQVLQWVYIVTVGSSQDLFEECITFWQYMLWYLACESEGGRIKVPEMYPILMHQISVLLIERMPTPIDMINVLDEDGKMRQIINNKRTFGNFFSTAKECLIFLTRLNSNDIKSVILERLNELYNGLNVDSIRSLCWAIGCIAGVSTDMENELLPKVLTILFSICQQIENPKDCALVAEGTVFVCQNMYVTRV